MHAWGVCPRAEIELFDIGKMTVKLWHFFFLFYYQSNPRTGIVHQPPQSGATMVKDGEKKVPPHPLPTNPEHASF
jgi:hypothetical protein